MTEATLTDGCCSSGDSGAVGRALSNVSHTPRCGGGRWTSGEKDLSGADVSTVPVRQPHRSLHVNRSNANMHCAGDVESSILEVPPPRRVSHPPRHSSVTVTAPTNKSLARCLTEGPWFIVEMAGYRPLLSVGIVLPEHQQLHHRLYL